MVEEEEVEEAFVVTVTAVEDTVVIKEVVVAVIDIEVDTVVGVAVVVTAVEDGGGGVGCLGHGCDGGGGGGRERGCDGGGGSGGSDSGADSVVGGDVVAWLRTGRSTGMWARICTGMWAGVFTRCGPGGGPGFCSCMDT